MSNTGNYIKVALLSDKFQIGGGLEHIYQIVRGLPGIRFGIFAENGPAKSKFKALSNCQIFCEGFHPQYITTFQPDIIHIHHLKPLFRFFRNPFKNYTVPIIFTMHGVHLHKYEFKTSISNRIGYSLRYHLEKYLYHKVDQLITVSQDDQQFVHRKYGIKKVVRVPNGLVFSDLEQTRHRSKAELRRLFHIPANQFIFLTIARFDFPKGYDILVKAISRIKTLLKSTNVKFIFVGDGKDFPRIVQSAKKASIHQYISFMKQVDPIGDIIRACDAFILPSRWEGLPLTLLEAGFHKIPVITTDTYGSREIVEDKINGFLVSPEDPAALSGAIKTILTDDINLSELGNNLYRTVLNNYNWENSLSKLKQLYLNILNQGINKKV